MKKILVLMMVSMAAGFASCVSAQDGGKPAPAPAPLTSPAAAPVPASPADELDAAVREASDYFNKQLPKGNKIVILNIQSEYPALSEYVIDELIANTVNDRVFSVVDRQQLNTIRAELDFQMSGEVDDDTAQALGRMAGAQIIVSGAVSRIGDLYRLRVRALSVESARIEGQFNRNIPDGPTVAALVKSRATGYGGSNYSGAAAAKPAAASAGQTAVSVPVPASTPVPAAAPAPTPPPAAEKVYKIGDRGPGGGIVFYDKGVVTNGSRYLEAAVHDLGLAQWGAYGTTINSSGTGKRATRVILEAFEKLEEKNSAAQICAEYEANGYKDWFLPSKDELNLMYTNLKKKGLGGFSSGRYWSSSENSGYSAWNQDFGNGNAYSENWNKSDSYSVRPIREF